MLTGTSPTDIEESWDEGDVNWTLFVSRAQQDARLQIARVKRIEPAQIPVPCSVLVDLAEEDFVDPNLVFADEKKRSRRKFPRKG